jgi:hypothetical protein
MLWLLLSMVELLLPPPPHLVDWWIFREVYAVDNNR